MPGIFVRLDHPKTLSYIKNELDLVIKSTEAEDRDKTQNELDLVITSSETEDRDKTQGNS